MKLKHVLILIILSEFAIVGSVVHIFGFSGISTAKHFATISIGYFCDTPEKYYVVQDVEVWSKIWTEFVQNGNSDPDPLPQVNFSEKTVIAVFREECPSGFGYAIKVKEIIDTGLTVVVRVEKTYDQEHDGCFVITAPYHVVATEKTDKYVIFETWYEKI